MKQKRNIDRTEKEFTALIRDRQVIWKVCCISSKDSEGLKDLYQERSSASGKRFPKFRIFLISLSWPVIVSSVLFGLSHFILLQTASNLALAIKIFVFSTFPGITAGYFQEKQNNTLAAILIHMTGNLPGLSAILLIN